MLGRIHLLVFLLAPHVVCGAARAAAVDRRPRTEELSTKAMAALLDPANDGGDVAVSFYTPWCPYCRQLKPIWEMVARALEHNRGIRVAQFNCEQDTTAQRVCRAVGATRYPMLMHFGAARPAGPMSKWARWLSGAAADPDSVTVHMTPYPGELYLQAIQDWVIVMRGLSLTRRLVGAPTVRNEAGVIAELRADNEVLEAQVKLLRTRIAQEN